VWVLAADSGISFPHTSVKDSEVLATGDPRQSPSVTASEVMII
jgi:hypothetical protein